MHGNKLFSEVALYVDHAFAANVITDWHWVLRFNISRKYKPFVKESFLEISRRTLSGMVAII